MNEKINDRPYIIRSCSPLDFTFDFREIQDKNHANWKIFTDKLLEKSKEGKLRPMESLDDETLYDLHSAFLPLYVSLAQIYNISKRKVGYIFQKRGISNIGACGYNAMRYGVREIDVDKFIEYLAE